MKKSSHIMVVPFSPDLIARCRGHVIVVRAGAPGDIPAIEKTVSSAGARLHCISFALDASLEEYPMHDTFQHLPIALSLDRLGPYRAVREKIRKLSQSNTRVFLPAADESMRSLRILSSLGVACGIAFNGSVSCWETLSDLMHYAVYGRLDHGPVEPFHYIVEHYAPDELTDFSSVYFNNVRKYLHLDERGSIALTRQECESGIFIAPGPEEVVSITEKPAYRERISSWRSYFIGFSRCACCKAWRICGGMFDDYGDAYPHCSELMSDLLEGAEFHRAQKSKKRELWQS
jgi:hypothetical protein